MPRCRVLHLVSTGLRVELHAHQHRDLVGRKRQTREVRTRVRVQVIKKLPSSGVTGRRRMETSIFETMLAEPDKVASGTLRKDTLQGDYPVQRRVRHSVLMRLTVPG